MRINNILESKITISPPLFLLLIAIVVVGVFNADASHFADPIACEGDGLEKTIHSANI